MRLPAPPAWMMARVRVRGMRLIVARAVHAALSGWALGRESGDDTRGEGDPWLSTTRTCRGQSTRHPSAKDAGETDLAAYLREQLAEQEIETQDEEWVQQVLAGIEKDPNYMIESEPKDYTPARATEAA